VKIRKSPDLFRARDPQSREAGALIDNETGVQQHGETPAVMPNLM